MFENRLGSIFSSNAVATSQIYATDAGKRILGLGGNAMDACVAMAAVLALTEPTSTGPGGDAFVLFYDSTTGRVLGINGSGNSGSEISFDFVKNKFESIPETHGCSVTVPGAVECWISGINEFGSGKVGLDQILAPAIELSEAGFKVAKVSAHLWKEEESKLNSVSPGNSSDLLLGKVAPSEGDLFRNLHLANVFKAIVKDGRKGFYEGKISDSIIRAVRSHGGFLNSEDLRNYQVENVESLSVEFRGVLVHECPPNGQGLVALVALGIAEILIKDKQLDQLNELDRIHVMIEILKISFKIGQESICDNKDLSFWRKFLLKNYLKELSETIDFYKASRNLTSTLPAGTDTVYCCAVDSDGNACSFINSIYMGFGSGIIPEECGFALQNRGSNFSMKEGHPNVLSSSKRPYHTIIPGMVTTVDGKFLLTFGVMGGFMQPQGHLIVLWNIFVDKLGPQEALNKWRFYVDPCTHKISIEETAPQELLESLKAKGHEVKIVSGFKRSVFGRGQVIMKDKISELMDSESSEQMLERVENKKPEQVSNMMNDLTENLLSEQDQMLFKLSEPLSEAAEMLLSLKSVEVQSERDSCSIESISTEQGRKLFWVYDRPISLDNGQFDKFIRENYGSIQLNTKVNKHDYYTARAFRRKNSERQGLCIFCLDWYNMRNSSYWHHMTFSHGLGPDMYHLPMPIAERKLNKSAAKQHLCPSCSQWIDYTGEDNYWIKPRIHWWRHIYSCMMFFEK